MPRKPAAPKAPKVKPVLTRNEVIGLCKRFLKPDAGREVYYNPAESPMTMYRLVKQYPDRAFWLAYQLGFELRSLFWLLGKDGQAKLKQDYEVFHLKMAPIEKPMMEETKQGEDVVIVNKPKTVADLLR